MQDLLAEVTRPLWWFSVVVAGVLVNVASGYVKEHLDSWLSRYSEARREKAAAETKARADRVVAMARDPWLRQWAVRAELRGWLIAITAIQIVSVTLLMALLMQSSAAKAPRILVVVLIFSAGVVAMVGWRALAATLPLRREVEEAEDLAKTGVGESAEQAESQSTDVSTSTTAPPAAPPGGITMQ